jgi:PhnB protein
VAKRSLADQLELALQALLERPETRRVSADRRFDPSLRPLLPIAQDLRELPREGFKARLKNDLQRRISMATAPQPTGSQRTQGTPPAAEYHTIAPYLIVPRAGEFIEFLKIAFAGTERFRFGRPEAPNFLMHAEVTIGDSIIELADANQQFPAAPQAIHLYVDDAAVTYQRALQAGATSIYEVGDHVSGDRQGAVRDPFGNIWYIAQVKGWTPAPGELRSVQPYLHLKDAAKMIPFLEKAFGGKVLGHVPTSPDGKVLHATIQIGDNTLELDEAHGEFQPMPCHLHLHIDDADAAYAQAMKAGAISIDPPSNKPYGRSAGVKDAFGNSWYMTSPLEAA